jgi:hypothetical protein
MDRKLHIQALNIINATEHCKKQLLIWYRSPDTARKAKKVETYCRAIARLKTLYNECITKLNYN